MMKIIFVLILDNQNHYFVITGNFCVVNKSCISLEYMDYLSIVNQMIFMPFDSNVYLNRFHGLFVCN